MCGRSQFHFINSHIAVQYRDDSSLNCELCGKSSAHHHIVGMPLTSYWNTFLFQHFFLFFYQEIDWYGICEDVIWPSSVTAACLDTWESRTCCSVWGWDIYSELTQCITIILQKQHLYCHVGCPVCYLQGVQSLHAHTTPIQLCLFRISKEKQNKKRDCAKLNQVSRDWEIKRGSGERKCTE